MLHPRIVEVTTEKKTGETYVLVNFWATKAARARDDPPFLIEDFVMQLRPTGIRPIDPDNPGLGVQPYDRDLVAEIEGNIWKYVARAERLGYEGDHTSQQARSIADFKIGGVVKRKKGQRIFVPIQRDNSDPHGVLAKPEVRALRGQDVDLEAVGP